MHFAPKKQTPQTEFGKRHAIFSRVAAALKNEFRNYVNFEFEHVRQCFSNGISSTEER